MKHKIVGIGICTLLMLSMIVGSIEVKHQERDLIEGFETMNNGGLLWQGEISAYRSDHYGGALAFSFGEATDANDGPPQDIYDRLLPIPSFIDIYSRDGFGILCTDFRHGPDTQKIWNVYIKLGINDQDMPVEITWDKNKVWWPFDITKTEYQVAIFYVHDGGYHIDMTQQDSYTYNHKMGQEDAFAIRLYQNTPPATPNKPSGLTAKKVGESTEYFTQATDPEGNTVQYRMDWGDGQISTWSNSVPSGQQASRAHAWQSLGTYYVKAQAHDQFDFESGWSQPLAVTITEQGSGNHPPETPEILEAPTTLQYGQTYEFTAVTTDPDDDSIVYIFSWDYEGDWTTVETDFYESGEPGTVQQSFESPGYTRFMTMDVGARDEQGLVSGFCAPLVMEISDPPEQVFITGNTSGTTGETYVYQVSGYDPNYNDLVSFKIDWGDGKSITTEEVPIMSLLNVSHTWDSNGDYEISVTVFDSSALEGPTVTLPVTMPYTFDPFQQFLDWLFQRFPHAFPLLRHLMGY